MQSRADAHSSPPSSSLKPGLYEMAATGGFTMDGFIQRGGTKSHLHSPAPREDAPQVETPPPNGSQPKSLAAPTPRTAPLSLEEKQERQRMHVRRSYYKKRSYIRNLKDRVEALEKEYAAALAAQPDKAHVVAAAVDAHGYATPPPETAASASSASMASEFLVPDLHDLAGSSPHVPASNEAVQVFMKLSTVRDTLRHENDELKKALIRYANFVRRVQQSIEDAETEAAEDPSPHLDVIDFSVSPSECQCIILGAYEEVKRFIESDQCVSTGVSLFGWRDKRRVIDGFVEFSVKKFYNDRSALSLAQATWEVLATPSRLASLYSPSMAMELRQIQRVDEDTVVYYRRIDRRSEGAGYVSKSIYLLSRLRTDMGYVIIFRTCDSERQRRERALMQEVTETEKEMWHDVFTWIMFEELGDDGEHAQFSFGGRVDTSAATPQFWMLEVLLLSLRWEANVVGPTFLLR